MDPVERRTVLIGAVGSTLLAIVNAQNAEAKTLRLSKPSITVDNTTIDLLSIRDVSVNKAKEADSWKELVTRISAADDEFKSFDKSFEKGVRGFWGEAQQVQEKRILASLPSSLRIA